MAFCKWCNELIEEDEICDKKCCVYLKKKLDYFGVMNFYLRTHASLQEPEKFKKPDGYKNTK